MGNAFPYDLAFDRNLGWVTEREQLALRSKRIAIAGMGGVGGVHLLTLARLGVGAFTIADLDVFEFANFNRQVGATVDTVGRPKAEVLQEMALAINPEIRIRRFDGGVDSANIDEFLAGADLFVDGFDFFALDIRRRVFARAAELGIPAITAAPIGMGTAYLVFLPGSMTFESYFRLEGQPEVEQYLRFLVGLTPRRLHEAYLVDPSRVDLAAKKGPSTAAACQLCSGAVATAALKLLLQRGNTRPAPYHHHFDAYRGRLAVTRLRFGNAGPVQRLKIVIGRRFLRTILPRQPVPEPVSAARSPVEEILNLARWAPSPRNRQPWRFALTDAETLRISIHPEPGDPTGRPVDEQTWLSVGMLVETLAIAATAWERKVTWSLQKSNGHDVLMVRLTADRTLTTDPLLSFITLRSVDRRRYRWGGLSPSDKMELDASIGPALNIRWHETLRDRHQIAWLSAITTRMALRCAETSSPLYRMLDRDRVLLPLEAPMSSRREGDAANLLPTGGQNEIVRRWSNWIRMPSAALRESYLPGIASAACFAITAVDAHPRRTDSMIEAGRGIQRFWLTATSRGLVVQPLQKVLYFAQLADDRRAPIIGNNALLAEAEALAAQFNRHLSLPPSAVTFLGRIGRARRGSPVDRSSRLPLRDLLKISPAGSGDEAGLTLSVP